MGIFHYKILFLLSIVSLVSCIEDPLKSNIDDKYISAVTNSNGNLFVVTSEGKIYSSTDAVNWTNVPISNSIVLLDIASNENGIIVSTGDNGIFFISTDFGATWDKKSTGTGSFLKQIKIINDSTYIAGGRSGTLIKTTDYGENWSNITTPFNHNISSITADGDKIYIGLRSNKEQDSLLYIYDFLADTIINSNIISNYFISEIENVGDKIYLSDYNGTYKLVINNDIYSLETTFSNNDDNFIVQKILFENELILVGYSGFNLGKVITGIPSNQEIKEFNESIYFNTGIIFNNKLIVCGGDENEIAIKENNSWNIIKLK